MIVFNNYKFFNDKNDIILVMNEARSVRVPRDGVLTHGRWGGGS